EPEHPLGCPENTAWTSETIRFPKSNTMISSTPFTARARKHRPFSLAAVLSLRPARPRGHRRSHRILNPFASSTSLLTRLPLLVATGRAEAHSIVCRSNYPDGRPPNGPMRLSTIGTTHRNGIQATDRASP